MENKSNIIKPSEKDIESEGAALTPDKDGIIRIDEIPDPGFDMKYFDFDEKEIKRVETEIRRSFEYRGLIQFIKQNLNINHCSFYEDYSMKNGLTIEIHHSPYTLYDITEAVMAKSMKNKGFWETFRIVEEVNMLHYQFKIGLTPLNPTAHKLVHAGQLAVHPKIVIGFWKEFYGEYQAYLGDAACKKYEDMIALENTNGGEPKIPKILEYRPTTIEIPNMQILTSELVDKLCVESKLEKLGIEDKSK